MSTGRTTHLTAAILGVAAVLAMSTLAAPAGAVWTARVKPAPRLKPVVTAVDYHGFASGGVRGGGRVTVKGHHFEHVKSVKFGDGTGSHITVESATKLMVTAPPHPLGEVHVRVTTRAGTSKTSSDNAFDYQFRRVLDGGVNSCQVVKSTGTVRCWGYNGDGELGNGTTTDAHTPVRVSGLTDAVSVSAGDDQTCALRASGAVYCWGGNMYGQLGDGTSTPSSVPVRVVGLGAKALDITAGGLFTCAVLVGNHAKCWGFGGDGQLGNGHTTSSPKPVGVRLSSIVDIAAGDAFTCATRSNGTEYCWGDDGDGELGDGTNTASSLPVQTIGITKAVATATGEDNGCVLTRTGGVRCWGSGNNGQLGNGATDNSSHPVAVSGITGATSLAFGSMQGCVLVRGGVQCWGFNNYGQLGNGTVTNADTPVAVLGLTHVTAIGAAGGHTLATVKDGDTEAWGGNAQGQLGNGTTDNSDVPVTVG